MKAALNALVGLVLLLGGGFFLWQEMHVPPSHTGHIYLFSGIALLGAFVIRPDPLFTVVKQLVVILGDTSIPWIGGRRKGDPPAPGGPDAPT